MPTFEFFGHRYTSLRLASYHPVVKDCTTIEEEVVSPHPEVFSVRQELNLEYGKLDYVVLDGEFHLLDVE